MEFNRAYIMAGAQGTALHLMTFRWSILNSVPLENEDSIGQISVKTVFFRWFELQRPPN